MLVNALTPRGSRTGAVVNGLRDLVALRVHRIRGQTLLTACDALAAGAEELTAYELVTASVRFAAISGSVVPHTIMIERCASSCFV